MRLGATRYASKAQPLKAKKVVAQIKHLQAPLQGLSVSTQMVTGDALTASILDNWIVGKDRVTVRPGLLKLAQLAAKTPIETIVPFYGDADTGLLASAGNFYDMAGVLKMSGFASNEWNWTAFSNLGDRDFTVMVNGANGVWSWDGGAFTDPGGAVAVTSLANTNPVRCTVAAADIGKFVNGGTVIIAGATGALAVANGSHQITAVNSPANTFSLVGIDGTGASSPQTTGVTADPQGGMIKEPVTAPAASPYVNPNNFHLVLSHMNRLWFADRANLALYYLPIQQKSGTLKELPLNALFRRGGYIKAMYSWTLDGGAGMEDQLVLFSSNGEAVIYGGTDPDSDFSLTGIFRFDAPMSMNSVLNYGGDLYVMVSTGLVPMSTLLRAETEQMGSADKNVTNLFSELIQGKHSAKGWQLILNYNYGWAICNIPTGAPNVYRQMVRFMPDPIWTSWSAIPSRCWQWIGKRLFLGSDDGALYELREDALSDNGQPIIADLQLTMSMYNSSALKHFKLISAYVISDGQAKPYLDIRLDYDLSTPTNQPDVTLPDVGSAWDVATWDQDYWAAAPKTQKPQWNGVASTTARVAAPRAKVAVKNCQFAIAGFDVVYETGAPVG